MFGIKVGNFDSPLDVFETEIEAQNKLSRIQNAGILKEFELEVVPYENTGKGIIVPYIDHLLN